MSQDATSKTHPVRLTHPPPDDRTEFDRGFDAGVAYILRLVFSAINNATLLNSGLEALRTALREAQTQKDTPK